MAQEKGVKFGTLQIVNSVLSGRAGEYDGHTLI
jgi:hypothetical protein